MQIRLLRLRLAAEPPEALSQSLGVRSRGAVRALALLTCCHDVAAGLGNLTLRTVDLEKGKLGPQRQTFPSPLRPKAVGGPAGAWLW